jgi:hypothetical protein
VCPGYGRKKIKSDRRGPAVRGYVGTNRYAIERLLPRYRGTLDEETGRGRGDGVSPEGGRRRQRGGQAVEGASHPSPPTSGGAAGGQVRWG